MSWRDFWNDDTPIYVNGRHKALHYGLVARDLVALIASPDAHVLDHGCGEALSASRVAAACGKLYLCDGAPMVRERLEARFGDEPKIEVLSPEELDAVPDHSLDLVIANSLLQYLSADEFVTLLGLWHSKLKEDGRLVLADIIPPDLSALDDVRSLLGFAWRGGFVAAAVGGLARTAISDYRRLRSELGLTHYAEAEMVELLRDRGFSGGRRATNIGPNPRRMTFVASPL